MLYCCLLMMFLKTALVKAEASNQIVEYAETHQENPGIMSTSAGAPVEFQDTNNTKCERLLFNEFLIDSVTHFVRERIPPRVVHTKGGGAFGYFEVTNDITDICKAALFSSIGKKTPIAIRFSPLISDEGGPDTVRGERGFAVKFYTEEGNFDIVGSNFPVFAIKDPILFPSLIRVQKRNPATHLQDANMLWDFINLQPTALFSFMFTFSDRGIPDGYRHMPGFSVNTYQVVNESGEKYFVQFHFTPDSGVKNLRSDEAQRIAGYDPDYFNRDLYDAIDTGDFPSWKVSIQVLTLDQVNSASVNAFDVTKILPLDKYPLRPVGRIYLNKNPINYFAEIEQLAFTPGNLVPGINGAPDSIFEMRRFTCRDAQNYRLGVNFNKIYVNCPLRSKAMTYNRDGEAPVLDNEGGAPNYYPNTFNGPNPYIDKNRVELITTCEDDSDNFDQIEDFYLSQTKDERARLVENIVYSLGNATKRVQDQAVYWLNVINSDLGSRVQKSLKN